MTNRDTCGSWPSNTALETAILPPSGDQVGHVCSTELCPEGWARMLPIERAVTDPVSLFESDPSGLMVNIFPSAPT